MIGKIAFMKLGVAGLAAASLLGTSTTAFAADSTATKPTPPTRIHHCVNAQTSNVEHPCKERSKEERKRDRKADRLAEHRKDVRTHEERKDGRSAEHRKDGRRHEHKGQGQETAR